MSDVTSASKLEFDLHARGPLSGAVIAYLTGRNVDAGVRRLADRAVESTNEVIFDEDIQLSLFMLYASSYGSLPQIRAELEWDTTLIETRRTLEQAFERVLRRTVQLPDPPEPEAGKVARTLFALAAEDSGPSMSKYIAKQATPEQAAEFLVHRSIYTLREADPHSWAIPRLVGKPKCALVEIQSDEYGGGHHDRVHSELFAKTMRGAGLDDRYGAYLNLVPAITLASQNMMSMFGLNRRLIGAIVGHLAAFEMTSSIPNRLYGDGFRRLGFGDDVTDYFDEHVEADAVHEQIAARDLAGELAETQPELLHDILFGAAACLSIDGRVGEHMLNCWTNNETSLEKAGTP